MFSSVDKFTADESKLDKNTKKSQSVLSRNLSLTRPAQEDSGDGESAANLSWSVSVRPLTSSDTPVVPPFSLGGGGKAAAQTAAASFQFLFESLKQFSISEILSLHHLLIVSSSV